MNDPQDVPLKSQELFIEGESGVQRVQVGLFEKHPYTVLRVYETSVLSGEVNSVSRDQMQQALKLHVWADEHRAVFEEGRVS